MTPLLDRAGLWHNAEDSIQHAFDHFSELCSSPHDKAHHTKWIILSVHHAAECYSSILLLDEAPDRLKRRTGIIRYPSLSEAVQILLETNIALRLSSGERRLLQLFGTLTEKRNLIMHRSLPDNLNASLSAMALLGLLKICRNRVDEQGWQTLRKIAQDQTDLFASISYKRVEEYCRLAEHLVAEEFAGECLSYCPCCEATSILGRQCQVCFEDMSFTECTAAGERVFSPRGGSDSTAPRG